MTRKPSVPRLSRLARLAGGVGLSLSLLAGSLAAPALARAEGQIRIAEQYGIVYLLLADDGQGADIDQMEKGFGLRHMQERLALLHGKLRYWSDSGFTLEAIVPENEEASNFL